MTTIARQFGVMCDRYFWQTSVLIARNGLARQYRNSFLGLLWTLLQPLVMVGVYSYIMPRIMRFPTPHYLLYVVVSLPLWNFFSTTLYGSAFSILANGETLKRCMVSSSVFPIADVLRNTYTLFISFTSMYVIALLVGEPFSPYVLLVPLYFIPVLMTIGAMCIAISFIAPFIRDIGELTIVTMTVMFWLTPVVYPLDRLSESGQRVMEFNPFYIMMRPIRELAYENTMPGLYETGALLALTLVAISIGFSIYRLCRRNYVYYL